MQSRPGPGSNGYNYQPEFIDWDCVVHISAGHVVATGQVLCRDIAAIPSVQGADRVVLPNHANAGPVYGVYQGAQFTNNTAVEQYYPITVRVWGYGVVSKVNAGISVGTTLIKTNALQAQPAPAWAADVAPPPPGSYIGTAVATGAATTPGTGIAGLVCNAVISAQ